jgi:hypothetical protein
MGLRYPGGFLAQILIVLTHRGEDTPLPAENV